MLWKPRRRILIQKSPPRWTRRLDDQDDDPDHFGLLQRQRPLILITIRLFPFLYCVTGAGTIFVKRWRHWPLLWFWDDPCGFRRITWEILLHRHQRYHHRRQQYHFYHPILPLLPPTQSIPFPLSTKKRLGHWPRRGEKKQPINATFRIVCRCHHRPCHHPKTTPYTAIMKPLHASILCTFLVPQERPLNNWVYILIMNVACGGHEKLGMPLIDNCTDPVDLLINMLPPFRIPTTIMIQQKEQQLANVPNGTYRRPY